jgi:hypothetical protein
MNSRVCLAYLVASSTLFALTSGLACTPETGPEEGCGMQTWANTPCSEIIKDYYASSGNCCSLSDFGETGCRLTVDGPNSECYFYGKDDWSGSGTFFSISDATTGTCPRSQYVLSRTKPPTVSPAPIASFSPAWYDLPTKKPTKKPTAKITCKKRNDKCEVQRGVSVCCGENVCRKPSNDSAEKKCLSCLKIGQPCSRPGECCSRKCSGRRVKRCVN